MRSAMLAPVGASLRADDVPRKPLSGGFLAARQEFAVSHGLLVETVVTPCVGDL